MPILHDVGREVAGRIQGDRTAEAALVEATRETSRLDRDGNTALGEEGPSAADRLGGPAGRVVKAVIDGEARTKRLGTSCDR